MALKYEALAAFLLAQPPETTAVSLTFADVEAIVGVALPRSARMRSWWTTEGRYGTQVRTWREVGWRASVQPRAAPPSVTFRRRLFDHIT
jgi:hypothetical protein